MTASRLTSDRLTNFAAMLAPDCSSTQCRTTENRPLHITHNTTVNIITIIVISVFMAAFHMNCSSYLPPLFPLQLSGTGFCRPDVLSVIKPTVSEALNENTKQWTKPVAWPRPFFNHHRTPRGRGAVPFMSAVWHQYQYIHTTNTDTKKLAAEAHTHRHNHLSANFHICQSWPPPPHHLPFVLMAIFQVNPGQLFPPPFSSTTTYPEPLLELTSHSLMMLSRVFTFISWMLLVMPN